MPDTDNNACMYSTYGSLTPAVRNSGSTIYINTDATYKGYLCKKGICTVLQSCDLVQHYQFIYAILSTFVIFLLFLPDIAQSRLLFQQQAGCRNYALMGKLAAMENLLI